MSVVKLSVWVGEDKRLIVDLPPEAPVGLVDIQISPHETQGPETGLLDRSESLESAAAKRERLRKKLMDAGMLSTAHRAPEGWTPLTEEERIQLGALPPGARPTDEYVDEDRGLY
jgi:hypothetical protein